MAKQPEIIELKPIEEFRLPKYIELPNVGLYLKQVVRLINDSLGPYFGITVTETMLSNYVKKHIIPSPKKKLYDRDQIAALMFITLAKTVVSLENIQLMLEIQEDTYDKGTAYDYMCNEFENLIGYVFGLKEVPDDIGSDTNETKQLLRNLVITIAHKFYLEASFYQMKYKINK